MSDVDQAGPWDNFQAPTAHLPQGAQPDYPWDAFKSSLPISGPEETGLFGQTITPPSNIPQATPQQVRNEPGALDVSVPDAMTVYGAGSLAKLGAQGIKAGAEGVTSLFEAPESLKSAGITAKTIENMAPAGQNPADYTQAVENQLKSNNALGTTGKETWDKMTKWGEAAGKGVADSMNAIKQAASSVGDPLMADAQNVMKPLYDEWSRRIGGLVPDAASAKPFEEYSMALGKQAQAQGGKLTLDNINGALKEVGTKLDESSQDMEPIYSKLYAKLADVRDSIVNTIANQAGDPALKSNLLKNNADYSTYMRVLPSVEKAGYKEAVKEGISAYQKYIGPLGEKLALAGGTYAATRAVMDKLIGNH